MITVLNADATRAQIDALSAWLENMGLSVHSYRTDGDTVLGIIGDTSRVDIDLLRSMQCVRSVCRISDPYKQANRKFHPADTVVHVGDVAIGGGNFALIAGPCSVESEEQIITLAHAVKASGASILRGGAFKPRTSPYAFQGVGKEGIAWLVNAKKETGLPIVTEVMSAAALELYDEVDMLQVGARNMQNYDLLKQLGKCRKPILLKRGLANTLQELLMSAEYIMNEGNEQIVLCERGIRTFEHQTRNTLDLSAVPMLHELSHLPVMVDPSHATGVAALVSPMALAAAACGADAIMVEVHNDPSHALCDGMQSLTPQAFSDLAGKITAVRCAAL